MEEVRSNLIVLGIFVEEPEGYVHPKELWSSMSGPHRYIHIIVYKYLGTYTSIDISEKWKNPKNGKFGEKCKNWENDKFGEKAQFVKRPNSEKAQNLRKRLFVVLKWAILRRKISIRCFGGCLVGWWYRTHNTECIQFLAVA